VICISNRLVSYYKGIGHLPTTIENSMAFESISLAWSPQCFCKGFMPLSIIALGSKAGIITLWSYTIDANLVYKIDACRSWIITLEWSRWWTTDEDTFTSLLIVGCLDGSYSLWKITLCYRRSELPDQEEDELVINAEKGTVLLEADKREPCLIKWFKDKRNQRDKLAMSKMSTLFIWAPALPVYDNFESVMPITFDFPDTVLIAGISWNNDGTRLCAFSLEGKQWILDISDSGISINKAATERLRKNVEDQLKDAFRKVMADEKDSENESEDDEGDDEIGSPLPFNIDGLDDCEETMAEDNISKSHEKDGATNNESMDVDETKTYTSDLLMQPQMLGIDASANGIFVAFVFAVISGCDMDYLTTKSNKSYLCFVLTENDELDVFLCCENFLRPQLYGI
ncbi:9304_t:CDS:2, partial [Paraglomus occultum]